MPMKKSVKAKWIKALRSGRYKQGNFTLRDKRRSETRYCCLGVLAQIQGCKWKQGDSGLIVPFLKGKQVGSAGYLDPDSKAAAGLTDRNLHTLAAMNDRRGM